MRHVVADRGQGWGGSAERVVSERATIALMTRDEFNRATLGKGTCYCRVEKPRGHGDKAIEHRAARARLHARLPREVDDQIDAVSDATAPGSGSCSP